MINIYANLYLQSRGSAPGVGDPDPDSWLICQPPWFLLLAALVFPGLSGLQGWDAKVLTGLKQLSAFLGVTGQSRKEGPLLWGFPSAFDLKSSTARLLFRVALNYGTESLCVDCILVNVDIIGMHSFHQVIWKQTDSYNML